MSPKRISRRQFLGRSIGAASAGLALPMIVPRRVLGGPGQTAPSEQITCGFIGVGGRGSSLMKEHSEAPWQTLAVCDLDKNHLAAAVKRVGAGCQGYHDFREVLDRKDIDVVYIATPPHWHALVSIAAAQAGKDVYCEKPMTKFIHEGRAVVEAMKRYGRVFQIGTGGRLGAARMRKLFASGLLGKPILIRMNRPRYNWKVREWSGQVYPRIETPPAELDYDFWLGPAPYKPYHRHRVHGSFRGYWDYDGGGFSDMGAHYFDPVQYFIGADDSGPVEIEAVAPWPPHPDAVGMWGSITYKFPGDITIKCASGEWGKDDDPADAPFIEGPKGKVWNERKADPPDLFDKLKDFPDPPRLLRWEEALRTRKEAGGNAEVSHRVATILHLGNLAIRLGRKLHWDPAKEQFIGDEEANRYVNIPMRVPWHL